MIHNGIIENFLALKDDLVARGHRFQSDTDTEVLAHLIEDAYRGDLPAAVEHAVAQTRGAYALVVLCADEPGRIVAVRRISPLIVGHRAGARRCSRRISRRSCRTPATCS